MTGKKRKGIQWTRGPSNLTSETCRPVPFDSPLPDTFEEFQKQFVEYLKSDRPLPDVMRFNDRWNVRESLSDGEQAFLGGERAAAIRAVSLCLDYQLPIPDWARNGLIELQRAIDSYEVRTWDELLGRPHPKGTHLATERKHRRLQPQVHMAVLEAIGNGRSVDEGLFEEIGRKFGLGKTLAADLYYREQKEIDDF